MARAGRIFVRVVAILIGIGFSARVAPARGGRGPSVEIVTAGSETESRELEEILRELIGYLAVSPHYSRTDSVDPRDVVTPKPEASKSLAHVWIDLSRSDRATVYIADGPWERVLVRNVPLKNGVDEVAREQIAHIVSAAVDALASGAHIGLTREEVERTLFGGEKAKSEKAGERGTEYKPGIPMQREGESGKNEDYSSRDRYEWRGPLFDGPPLDLGLFYEAQAWTKDQLLVHGPGAMLHSALNRAAGAPGIWFFAQYRFAVTEDQVPIGVRLHSGALRALGTYDVPIAERLRLRSGLGLGIDLVNVEPRITTAGANATVSEERTTIVPLVRGLAALQYRAFPNTTLTAAFGFDLELVNARYTVDDRGTSTVVLDPWPIRPALMLGISSYVIAPP